MHDTVPLEEDAAVPLEEDAAVPLEEDAAVPLEEDAAAAPSPMPTVWGLVRIGVVSTPPVASPVTLSSAQA